MVLICSNWYPMFVLIFYFLCPLPLTIAGSYEDQSTSASWHDFALFVTAGIVVSAFSLPIVLAHAPLSMPVMEMSQKTKTNNILLQMPHTSPEPSKLGQVF
ncbi:unnamed protein product [Soboliphyme baturini]|uniref:Ovule protein n=1 Tax=Soboliphyme baturini TaxID=241478 RepID=A0A183IIN7_9BILA|nr:unnamed protein product [Soboliphyme baturini]